MFPGSSGRSVAGGRCATRCSLCVSREFAHLRERRSRADCLMAAGAGRARERAQRRRANRRARHVPDRRVCHSAGDRSASGRGGCGSTCRSAFSSARCIRPARERAAAQRTECLRRVDRGSAHASGLGRGAPAGAALSRGSDLPPRQDRALRTGVPRGPRSPGVRQADDRNRLGERPHATLTKEYRIEPDAPPDHHSRQAFADLVAFFDRHLRNP